MPGRISAVPTALEIDQSRREVKMKLIFAIRDVIQGNQHLRELICVDSSSATWLAFGLAIAESRLPAVLRSFVAYLDTVYPSELAAFDSDDIAAFLAADEKPEP